MNRNVIKHISFDLWLTIIKSHAQFKMKRATYIAEHFCDKALSSEEIDKIIRTIDKEIDADNEQKGTKLPATSMYKKILKEVNNNTKNIHDKAIKLKEISDKLFLENLPEFLNSNIINILQTLTKRGYTLNISSNTGFIEGHILRIALKKLNIDQYFSFFIFSDEIGYSKPSRLFFENVYKKVTHLNKKQILHIGDNTLTDFQGASHFGFQALLINKDYNINDINTRL